MRWCMRLGLLLLLLGIMLTGCGALWVNNLPIDKLATPLPLASVLYDKDGKAVSKLGTPAQVEPVKLADIARPMRDAIVAIEDRRFYKHEGVDFNGLARAVYRNAKSGGIVEGGSTITQQLAKNVFLSPDRTYKRKLREAALAMRIEMSYSKDKILEMYLNQIYFGEGAWGIQKAARHYFGKKASELTLPEAALLAGLPKAPNNYSPVKHPKAAFERRNLVLGLMREQGMITEDEYMQASHAPLKLYKGKTLELRGNYPSYVEAVLAEAEKKYGISEKELMTGGYRVYTGLDLKVQTALERAFAKDELFPPNRDDIPVQAGMAVTDPKSGQIRGLIGGRGDTANRGLNRAIDIRRQPGSAIKPLAVYGPAIEKGFRPDSVLQDKPIDFAGYRPKNSGGKYRGAVSLTQALIHSHNVPAVWLLNEIGVGTGASYVRKAGIPLRDEDVNLSLALGGMSGGVSPLQLAQAYGALANGGVMREAHAIVKIVGADGKLVEKAKPHAARVFRKETSYRMTRLLEKVVEDGTGKRAALERPVAGKTGTTQLPKTKEFAGLKGSRDVWFAGYTPELVAAVWMGYDRTDPMHFMDASGGTYPAALFRKIMAAALDGTPVRDFAIPRSYGLQPASIAGAMSAAAAQKPVQVEQAKPKTKAQINQERRWKKRVEAWNKKQEKLRKEREKRADRKAEKGKKRGK